MKTQTTEELYKQLLDISLELTRRTGRVFTLDGHLVGSIGEVYASNKYGIELYEPSHDLHDGKWKDREVQIKMTQNDVIPISASRPYDRLLVYHLNKGNGDINEIYNGDGLRVLKSRSHCTPNRGQVQISFAQLLRLQKGVGSNEMITI